MHKLPDKVRTPEDYLKAEYAVLVKQLQRRGIQQHLIDTVSLQASTEHTKSIGYPNRLGDSEEAYKIEVSFFINSFNTGCTKAQRVSSAVKWLEILEECLATGKLPPDNALFFSREDNTITCRLTRRKWFVELPDNFGSYMWGALDNDYPSYSIDFNYYDKQGQHQTAQINPRRFK